MFYTDIRTVGNNVLIRGIDDDGNPFRSRHAFKPYFFLATPEDAKPDAFTLDKRPVSRIDFDSIQEAKNFLEKYGKVQGYDIHGIRNFAAQFITKKWPGDVAYDYSRIRRATLDLEVKCPNGFPHPDEAKEEILLVSFHDSYEDKIHVWTSQPVTRDHGARVVIHLCSDEISMLNDFLRHWTENTPDIITGWNVRFFDIAYLINRLKRLKLDLTKLSPWGFVQTKTISLQKKQLVTYDISGVSIMDYQELYKKYAPNGMAKESYKLDFIAKEELKRSKKAFDCSFQDFYTLHWEDFVEYNIIDVDLVDALDRRLDIIRYIVDMAYFAKVPSFTDVYGPVKLWEIIVHNWLFRYHNIVVTESERHNSKSEQYEGAYVKDPIIGKHNWVVNFDLNSLYPSIARQWNIGPETRVPEYQIPEELQHLQSVNIDDLIHNRIDLSILKDYDLSFSANRQFYRRAEKSFFSEIFGYLYNERVKVKDNQIKKAKEVEVTTDEKKKEQLKAEIAAAKGRQQALKVLLNSAYGAIGNSFFMYYSLANAEAITVTGQYITQRLEHRINEYFCKTLKIDSGKFVVAADTDSVYLVLDKLIEQLVPADTPVAKIVSIVDKMVKSIINPFINDLCKDIYAYTNCAELVLEMKREYIAETGIWVGKKNYLLWVHDAEGVRYKEPELKITGLKAIKSSTPAVCRERIKEILKLMVTKGEKAAQASIADFKIQFMKMPLEAIATPSSINDISTYSTADGSIMKGTPIHVRGALLYNRLLERMNLLDLYIPIKDGMKIRYIYLREPNVAHSHVIAYPDDLGYLPKEFKLHDSIDYNTQFEKTFLPSISSVMEVIGWSTEAKSSLENWLWT